MRFSVGGRIWGAWEPWNSFEGSVFFLLRLFDLESVIKDGYWHPDFRGRTSIKYVLPAMVKDLAYDGLAIRGGDDAAGAFALMYVNQTPTEQHEAARAALLAYCKLDTLAMVRVHEELLTIRARPLARALGTGRARVRVVPPTVTLY